MDESTTRLLVLGLIVIGFMLFNHFARQAARRLREQQEAAARAAAAAAAAQEEAEPADIWGRPVPPPPPAAIETAPEPRVVPAVLPPARAAHPLFRTPQDLRHAIVMMTVLGPCRALEPFDRR